MQFLLVVLCSPTKKYTMKRQILILVTCLILLNLLTTACKKQSDFIEKVEIPKITVKNDMLYFLNKESFNETINDLSDKNLNEVDDILSSYDFISLNSDSLNENRDMICDPIFKRLLNSNSSLQIGDDIFVIKDGFEYLISNGDIDTYKSILKNEFPTSSINLKKRQLNFKKEFEILNNKSEGDITISAIPPFQGTRSYYSPEYNNGRPERVYMEIYSQSFVVYASQGVLMRGQAYRRGGVFGSRSWRPDEMYLARMFGLQPIANSSFGQVPFDTGYIYNQEEVNYTIRRWDASGGTVPANPTISRLDVTFQYQKTQSNPFGSLFEQVN